MPKFVIPKRRKVSCPAIHLVGPNPAALTEWTPNAYERSLPSCGPISAVHTLVPRGHFESRLPTLALLAARDRNRGVSDSAGLLRPDGGRDLQEGCHRLSLWRRDGPGGGGHRTGTRLQFAAAHGADRPHCVVRSDLSVSAGRDFQDLR